MKALTICQPYAQLIAIGDKRVENRTWPTNYRGPLAIHAGKSRAWLMSAPGDGMVFGAIVARAELVTCIAHSALVNGPRNGFGDLLCRKYPWLNNHAHALGPWCWVLDNVERIAPIPCKGAQGLWAVSTDLLNQMRPL